MMLGSFPDLGSIGSAKVLLRVEQGAALVVGVPPNPILLRYRKKTRRIRPKSDFGVAYVRAL